MEQKKRSGVELIAAERARQVDAEGWTPEHDDHHTTGALAEAAICYADQGIRGWAYSVPPERWPWTFEWWKPASSPRKVAPQGSSAPLTNQDRVRNLTKAGALIAAEIDRVLRATPSEES